MKDKNKAIVKPIREIDLSKVSVYGLIQMLDKGEHFDKENDAYWMWMSLQAASQRGWDIHSRKNLTKPNLGVSWPYE